MRTNGYFSGVSASVTCSNRGLERARTKLGGQRLRPIQCGESAPDVHRIPLGAILIKQQDRRAVLGDARRQTGRLEHRESAESMNLAFPRGEVTKDPPKSKRLLTQHWSRPLSRPWWPSTLVAEWGKHGKHRRQLLGPFSLSLGSSIAAPACASVRLARTTRCATVASVVRYVRAISRVVRPPTSLSVSVALRLRVRTGWQQTNVSRSTSSST
jgi:hypothetical protein